MIGGARLFLGQAPAVVAAVEASVGEKLSIGGIVSDASSHSPEVVQQRFIIRTVRFEQQPIQLAHDFRGLWTVEKIHSG